jgi:hypothetical protein
MEDLGVALNGDAFLKGRSDLDPTAVLIEGREKFCRLLVLEFVVEAAYIWRGD